MPDMPNIDIRPDHWEIVRDILQKYVPQYEVWAFGSRAKWTAKEFSDLDLAIITDKPLPREVSAALVEAFDESDLPYKVDMVDFSEITNDFKNNIEFNHILAKKGNVTSWIDTTIGDQATLQRGFDITRAEQIEGNIPVISSSGISSYHNCHAVEGPGVVLGRKGVVGSVFYCASNYWPHDTTLWVKNFHGNDERFVYYFFKSLIQTIINLDVGTANPTLNRNHLHPTKIKWPPLSEQRAIAHILGTLDDKIELNRRQNATLEAMAQALFKDWFVDFGPVRAKMEGRQPEGMTKKIAELFPDRLDEEGKPEGWEWKKCGDIIEIFDSKRIPLSGKERSLRQGSFPYYGAASIMDYIDSYIFDGTYLLLGEDGTVVNNDSSPVLQYVCGKFWVNNHAHILRGKYDISVEHLYQFFKNINIVPYITGAVQPKITQKNLCSIPFLYAGTNVHSAFSIKIGTLYKNLKNNTAQSEILSTLRDTLFPKLISGELRIPDAEKLVGDAV